MNILLLLLPSTFLNLTFKFSWCALIVSKLPELIRAALLFRLSGALWAGASCYLQV